MRERAKTAAACFLSAMAGVGVMLMLGQGAQPQDPVLERFREIRAREQAAAAATVAPPTAQQLQYDALLEYIRERRAVANANVGRFQIFTHPITNKATYLVDTVNGDSWVLTVSGPGTNDETMIWERIQRITPATPVRKVIDEVFAEPAPTTK